MELFIPSLFILVLSALVIFVLLPKMAPYTIGGLALALFALGVWQNYKMFPYEYKSTMLMETLREHSPFVMLTAVIIGSMIFILSAYGPSPPTIASVIAPANTTSVNVQSTNVNNKKESSIFNLSGNTNTNTKRNNTNKGLGNIASASFKTV